MWSPTPTPDPTVNRGTGWSPEGVAEVPIDSEIGWWVRQQLIARAEHLGEFPATLAAHLRAVAETSGAYPATLVAHLVGVVASSAVSTASLVAHLNAVTEAQAEFPGRTSVPGIAPMEATGQFLASLQAHLLAVQTGAGEHVATLAARLVATLDASATFPGRGAYSPVAPTTTAFTTVGAFTYPIPAWSIYVDAIGVGGGRGGQTGSGANSQPGSGGLPGVWAGITLQRGVDIPWSEVQLTGVVGAGGAGGANSDNAAGQPGGNTTITASVGTLTAAGGTGVNSGSTRRDGPGPGDYTYLDTTYTGGALSDGSGLPGNPPGGGGSGGNGGVFGNRTRGGAGARGQAWLRARQS
ncbi:minor tail protein [Gordonia phage Foxboro]|uniref:Glycine-rich domain-containing protein n=1 Tax=Gordonia phage Foxboro TaxID=2301602 RepID=A0A385UCL5_9CAUD|nr:minor tail protein [Gordonia phage Foxboro]AYB69208.1 hypothetical protein SEA_FOXBORO_45 [Gordonia phage Foxboro]